jgi:subtilase family serine protease
VRRRSSKPSSLLPAAIWLAFSLVILSVGPGAVGSSARRAFGHVPQNWINRSHHQGRHSATDRLHLAITLAPRDQPGLDDTLKGLYDPSDPRFHQFLKKGEFQARFAPTDAQVDSMRQYLEARGLRVHDVAGNMVMNVEGSTVDVENAFAVELHDYITDDGRTAYSNTSEPLLQGEAVNRVAGVTGLSNFVKARHPHLSRPHVGGAVPHVADPFMTPAKLRTAYSVTGVASTGTNQKVALMELDGYTASDITAYAAQFPPLAVPTLTNVLVSDGTTTPTGVAGNDTVEVTLDIEVAMAMAPGLAGIVVYEAPNTGQGIINCYQKIATNNSESQVSSSWGNSENNFTASFMKNSEAPIFQQMAAQGQSVYAAAGDNGAYDDGNNPTTLLVDDPASQPWVVGVGGTKLTADTTTGAYTSETSWANFGTTPHEGGGGGISSVWSIPSFQSGLGTAANGGSAAMRMVPDVSLDADPNTGYWIYVTEPNQAPGWAVVGGTSAAAPVWAAFTAIVNQGRIAGGHGTLGNPNALFTALGQSTIYANVFHDVADNSTNLFYHAVAGYDLATGWGTINGVGLYNALIAGIFPPTPPASLTATSSATQLTLTWPAVANAATYNVYRSPTGAAGSYVLLTNVATTTANDGSAQALAAVNYYYVTAVNAVAESKASPVAFGQANQQPPSAPPAFTFRVSK